jgi:Putative auto-transporter adhesin, head GIN domain
MKKNLTFTALIYFASFALFAQDIITENRKVSNFNAVKVGSGIDLYLKQTNNETLTLKAPSDKIGKIITEVRNGVLNIYVERSNWNWNWGNKTSPKVLLSFKDLNMIVANGGSDVFSDGRLLFDKIHIEANGGSDVKLELTADAVECNTSGGSDAILAGTTKYFKGEASGGSDLKAKDLRSQSSRVNSSGGSDIYIWVESALIANSSGGSDVYYYGNPHSVEKHSSGGSDISRR